MFLSTAIPLAALFVSPVWAQLDSARCSTGFDWVRVTCSFSVLRLILGAERSNFSLCTRLLEQKFLGPRSVHRWFNLRRLVSRSQ